MCLIIDNNLAAALLLKSNPVEQWLFGDRGEPRLVAGGKLLQELSQNHLVLRRLRSLQQAGRLREMEPKPLAAKQRRILLSNDAHVVGLVLASGARTVCTEDHALIQDVRNPEIVRNPRCAVYRDSQRQPHLLRHTQSCGIA